MFGITAYAAAPFASLAGPTVVVAITGVEASGAVGTVGYMPFATAALTGVEAVGAVGDVTEENNPSEDGVAAVGAVGITLATITVSISGVSARGQVGTFDEFYWTTIDDSETPNWQNVAMTV